jgi:Ca2+-binding RTX toxin-like protein
MCLALVRHRHHRLGRGLAQADVEAGTRVGLVDIGRASLGDQMQELVNQGTDTVLASVTFSLEQSIGVENLTLTGKKAIAATGSDAGNILAGNSGGNALSGLGGKDVLDGGKGDDTLSGGTLAVRFVFKTGYGNDTISDFDATTAAHDKLDLSGLNGIDTTGGLSGD